MENNQKGKDQRILMSFAAVFQLRNQCDPTHRECRRGFPLRAAGGATASDELASSFVFLSVLVSSPPLIRGTAAFHPHILRPR